MDEVAVSQNDGLTRNVGFFGLLLTSEGSIIGSGWLFGALVCATIGGPAAIIAWLIGSVAVILLALVHAELGGMFPVSGGTTRFPYYAFGGLAGASFGWFSWLQAVGTAPIEVEAAITYTSNYWHGLTHSVNGTVVLTGLGYLVATVLMALFVAVNLFGVRYLVRANNAITTWKVIIPTLTIVVLFFTHFDTSNFTAAGGFAPYGLHGVLRAVSDGGAVFALVGFEQAVQLGGESRNPQRDMPRAVIFSMLIGATIYILLAGGVHRRPAPPGPGPRMGQHLLRRHLRPLRRSGQGPGPGLVGLHPLRRRHHRPHRVRPDLHHHHQPDHLRHEQERPRAGHLREDHQEVERPHLRTHLRLLDGPAAVPALPRMAEAGRVHHLGHRPDVRRAPHWPSGALRHQKPDAERPYRLPWAPVLAPASFVSASLIIYWSGWEVDWKLMVAVVLGYLAHVASRGSPTPIRSTRPWTGRRPSGCGPTWPG